jgi:argininosuccinate synthase
MKNNKVVLAFSGGLDTSFCAVYLSKVKNLEVHAVTVNTGGFTRTELDSIEERALSLGAASFTVLDETESYYRDCIRYLIFGNVLKNNTYPLSVSAERVQQATSIARFAAALGVSFIAHGSTGAGNDQVRFDMIFRSALPDVEIITPIRDLCLSREQEIEFLENHGVFVDTKKAAYSINKGLWGTSVGGRETLTSHLPLPEHAYPSQLGKQDPEQVILHFTNGELTGLNENICLDPVTAIQQLQELAAPFAIGRDIHVGDTIIGIKGRVGFEAAAPILIIKAHHALEKHVLSKWQLFLKDQLSSWYGNWLHEGLFLDPAMRDIEQFFKSSQQQVTGKVFLTLHPYRYTVDGIESQHDLMQSRFGSYGEMNRAWTGDDVKGFSRIFGNNISIYHLVNNQIKQEAQ